MNNRLKKRLFVNTYKYYRQYQRYQDSNLHTELEVLAAKSSFQTFYRFLIEEGLEDEYLIWVSDNQDK